MLGMPDLASVMERRRSPFVGSALPGLGVRRLGHSRRLLVERLTDESLRAVDPWCSSEPELVYRLIDVLAELLSAET